MYDDFRTVNLIKNLLQRLLQISKQSQSWKKDIKNVDIKSG